MQAVKSLVWIQAVVLFALLALWSNREELPAPAAVVASTSTDHAPPVAATAASATDSSPERRRAPSSWLDRDGQMRVVLQGLLLGLDPIPEPDSVRITLRRDSTWRSGHVQAGTTYAVPGLTPGLWTIRCEVPGHRLVEIEHELTAAPIQRFDIHLEKAQTIAVFVRTRDDKRLAAQLLEKDIMVALRVVASKTGGIRDFDPTEQSSVGNVGIGRYRMPSDLMQRAEPDGQDGTLELDAPPPATAALLLRHLVLAETPIVAGQTELRFVVDFEDVLRRLTRVRLRVLGADGGPVAAIARLSSAQGGGSSARTSTEAATVLENVTPGLASLEITAKGCESFSTHVTIPSGGEFDLGDLRLTAAGNFECRIVDENGSPVAASATWTALDQWKPPHPLIDRRSTNSDGDGKLNIFGVGLRRYTVQVRTSDGRAGFAIVDAAAPRAEPLVLTVRPTRRLELESKGDRIRCVVIADAEGRPLDVRRVEAPWRNASIRLPDGDYRFRVYDGAGASLADDPLSVSGADVRRVLP